ncbi:ChiA Chitinase [Pyrenophora tritici-repentis]|uniref:chitinase n=2 Tax=Pyrenophora tritici-repentis TaxID=45151 RepID=A0A2W1GZX6_9PLEO|nr:bacteriodes thetaiotaomicron symbiotic chitinase [Pyrenophora tritici-repentis Pt-1C-BFP]KAA8621332.1 Glycoside hydrolase family 18 protein [Pyrenophora tritici-repentis]EDU43712.1 bacteriodes thetaiotaomicron symbiotic chitinase [Pyrenophora tritici-repentis Pt-1C-BFP]KAF7450567.1 Glycoside hydrolase family 18 protein [Pyrenophora tritici-repentis]KAF7573185.1 ChiA, Chitinase [Pyrenophora tritici-repentis]KAG9381213.1 Glycoside hydrolase family 18 protein [Pyrenophora tritici-repentis]
MRQRDCDQIWPSSLNTNGYTSIVLSFAIFNSITFEVGMKRPEDEEVYNQFFKLPASIYKGIAIGEWAMSHDGETSLAWSKMASTKENRKSFVDSLKQFLEKWKFDKIEIHWEWPGASDTQNQVDLIHEVRQALGSTFVVSVVLPAQEGYLKNMNPGAMQDDVNWFTVLTYDLHGSWDDISQGIKPHTDLAEIDGALNLLWTDKIDPAKVLMGVANYGRGYTVADTKCNYYGCEFVGASKPGGCTKTGGFLSACEINRIIGEKNLKPHIIAGGAGVKEIAWDDQWVGYDDPETLGMKLQLADKHGLSGTALWAIDFDCNGGNGGAPQQPGTPITPGPSPSDEPAYPAPIPSGAPLPTSSAQGSVPSFLASPSSLQSSPALSSNVSPLNPSSVQGSPVPSSTQGYSSVTDPSPMPSSEGSALPSSQDWNSQTSSQPVGSSVAFSLFSSTPSITTGASTPLGISQTPPSSSNSPTVSWVSSVEGFTTAWFPITVIPSISASPSGLPPGSTDIPIVSWVSSVTGSSTVWFPITVIPSRSAAPPSSKISSTDGVTPLPPLESNSSPASPSQAPSGNSSTPMVSWAFSSVEGSTTVWFPITVSESSSVQPPIGTIGSSSGSNPVPSSGSATNSPAPSVSSDSPAVSWVSSVEGSMTLWFPVPVPIATQSDPIIPPHGTISSTDATVFPRPVLASSTDSSKPDPTNSPGPGPTKPSSPDPTDTSSSGPAPGSSAVGTIAPSKDPGEPSAVLPVPSDISPDPSGVVPVPVPVPGPPDGPDPKDDPDCVPNDCILDCIKWRVVTFLLTKRPFCPCVVKACNDGHKKKPKPTSYPKNKNKKCNLFGCGCGYMGLGFGPGCGGDDKDFIIPSPCGVFGCDPCQYFGCPGRESGIIGVDGYCLGEGCSACPPEICSLPGCTISGGCGPKPGPAPNKPSNRPDPEECEDNQRTVITERFVWCTEGYNVSALPTSVMGTSSTLITSMCVPWIDATVTVCGGAIQGFDTTMTQTDTETVTTDDPACTRAPLSLDDDEGNNDPNDSLSTVTSFDSMSSKPSSTPSSVTSTTPSTTSSTTSSATPIPEPTGSMDKYGMWTARIQQYMWDDYSEMHWTLFDPNGNNAGEHGTHGNGLKEIKDVILTVNRPSQHQMPVEINVTVLDVDDLPRCRVNFEFNKVIDGCDYMKNVQCRPYFTSEMWTEREPFALQTCEDSCKKNGKDSPLQKTDLWCEDLNTADWEQMATGWKRDFTCGWKGF